MYLGCTPDIGTCGEVYPVSVALLRQGSSTALARFTTFLTYEEPNSQAGALRVATVMPLGNGNTAALAETLSDHHSVAVTLAVDPRAAATLAARHHRVDSRELSQLGSLTSGGGVDQLISQPYVPINLAALESAGLGGEITYQVDQGTTLLRQAGLHPADGTWVDAASTFTSAQTGQLSDGLAAARAHTVVLDDGDLASTASNEKYTFASPFSLDGLGGHVTALAADSALDSRFVAASRRTRCSRPTSCSAASPSSTTRTPSCATCAAWCWSRRPAGGPPRPWSMPCWPGWATTRP